jgi:hypothetical protein
LREGRGQRSHLAAAAAIRYLQQNINTKNATRQTESATAIARGCTALGCSSRQHCGWSQCRHSKIKKENELLPTQCSQVTDVERGWKGEVIDEAPMLHDKQGFTLAAT